MLGKLREVVSLSEEIKELKNSLFTLNTELSELKKTFVDKNNFDIDNTKKEKAEFNKLITDISSIKNSLQDVSKEYLSELNAFRITKKNIQERLQIEFRDESKKISTEMSSYLSSYKDLEEKMKKITTNIESFNITINSLKSLSEEIIKKDFELKNYAKILDNNDREKVELLKKIDYLEKLLSSMKRNNSQKNFRN